MISTRPIGSGRTPHRDFELPGAHRGIAIAAFLTFAGLDLFVPHVNFSVLFFIPLLLLLGRAANFHVIWYYVGLVVVAIYAIFVVKQLFVYGRDPSVLISYRIFNRTFIAIMMGLMGVAAQAWLYWQGERSLNKFDQQEEDEVNVTSAVIACVGLGLLITAIDLVSPGNFNLPVLSVVPLYLISWTRDRRSLWLTAFILIALTWVGYSISPPPIETGWDHYILINRLLLSFALVLQAGILTWQLHCDQRDAAGTESA